MIHDAYPMAIHALAEVLSKRGHRGTPREVVAEAKAIIIALNEFGFQVGPRAAFGPHDEGPVGYHDPFDSLARTAANIERVMGRKPWDLPPELK